MPRPHLPNFLVIGASRSGTTSLYHHLRRHPEVYVPSVMEPRFFAFEDDAMDYQGPGDELLKDRIVTRLADYMALFENCRDEPAVGEISPVYLSNPAAPDRIRRLLPDVRLIAILRNPVERAVSSFRLHRLHGLEPEADLEVALALETERMRRGWSYTFAYAERGFYSRHLQRYLNLFSKDRILVHLAEDWSCPENALLRSVCGFLGVGVPQAKAVHLNSTHPAIFAARSLEHFVPTPKLLANLVSLYTDDIKRLADLIDRDLDHWFVAG